MKLCAIQIPYGTPPDLADNAVDFLIRELAAAIRPAT